MRLLGWLKDPFGVHALRHAIEAGNRQLVASSVRDDRVERAEALLADARTQIRTLRRELGQVCPPCWTTGPEKTFSMYQDVRLNTVPADLSDLIAFGAQAPFNIPSEDSAPAHAVFRPQIHVSCSAISSDGLSGVGLGGAGLGGLGLICAISSPSSLLGR